MDQIYVRPGKNPDTSEPYVMRDEYERTVIPAVGRHVKRTILTERRLLRGEFVECEPPVADESGPPESLDAVPESASEEPSDQPASKADKRSRTEKSAPKAGE